MSVHAGPALPAIGILAVSLSLAILAPHGAATAAECLTAPSSPAPQGSHWYYRIERPSLRKCWRLVQKDRNEQNAAQTAPQPGPEGETAAVPAAATSIPAARMAAPDARPAPEPVIRNLVTRNVSNPSDPAQPLPPTEPAASAMSRVETPSAPAAQEPTIRHEPAPAANVQRPVPAADETAVAADAEGAPTLRLLLLATALLGLLGGAVFVVMEIVRRRTDVLTTVRDANTVSFEAPPEALPAHEWLADTPTFAPLRPIVALPREDDVDEALRRFRQNARRRAA